MTSVHDAALAALSERLDADDAGDQKDAIKAEIIALYRTVDQQVAELSATKESIKGLIDRWKALHAATTHTPEFAADKPVIQADHLGASTFVEKGWSLLCVGDYAASEQALMRAIELSPNDPNSEALLGWALMLQEKHDDALMWFQKVMMSEPQNCVARINVGYICLKKRIFGEAIEHLSRAIRMNGDKRATLYAHFYLGLVYFERDMIRDAQDFFRKTLELAPNFIQAYYELGRALASSGQHDAAKQAWSDGFAANKRSPWGKRCAEALKNAG